MSKKAEIIGQDINYEMLYAGDTIEDAFGRKYVLTDRGTGRDAVGRETLFRDIKGPKLVPGEKKTSSPVAAAVKAVPAAAKFHAYDDPKMQGSDKKEEKPAPPKERKPRKVYSGRVNLSGMVRITNLAKSVGYNLGHPTELLRLNGLEILKDKTGIPCVRCEDRETARDLLARAVAGEDMVPSSEKILELAAKEQANVKLPPPEKKSEPAPAQETAQSAPPRIAAAGDELKEILQEIEKVDISPVKTIKDYKSEDLVAELRARGFEVTCIKHIEL